MQNLCTDKRKTIVGLGLTGFSCARYLDNIGVPFRVVDSRMEPPMKQQFMQQFPTVDLHCGAFTHGTFTAADELIISPGVSLAVPAIAAALAQGASLSSDIALFLQANSKPVIAITGSNGKSTVTTLVTEMLNHVGIKALAAGNIGFAVLDALTDNIDVDIYVLELSSFQLERLDKVSAAVATVLNVSDDHMDRYASFAHYQASKERIYQGATRIVINRQQPLNVPQVEQCISFGLDAPMGDHYGIIEEAGKAYLAFGEQTLIACDAIKIRGSHNWLNALAALALCQAVGVSADRVVGVLTTFSGLKHRCQWVADVQGVHFYNDSKATNTGATIAAIQGMKTADNRIILIAGGEDKDSDFSAMAEIIRQQVAYLILIGKDAGKIAKTLKGFAIDYASSMQDAVAKAFKAANAGDVVLLAPACASFDMFDNYMHRGDVFMAAVEELGREYAL